MKKKKIMLKRESDTFPTALYEDGENDISFPIDNKVKIGNETFTYVPSSKGREIISLSQKQLKFLNELLISFNPQLAAKKANVKQTTARSWFKSKKFAKYFHEKKIEKAHAQGLTIDFISAKLYKVLTGSEFLTEAQEKMMPLAAKVLGMTQSKTVSPFPGADEFVFVARKGGQKLAQSNLPPGVIETEAIENGSEDLDVK